MMWAKAGSRNLVGVHRTDCQHWVRKRKKKCYLIGKRGHHKYHWFIEQGEGPDINGCNQTEQDRWPQCLHVPCLGDWSEMKREEGIIAFLDLLTHFLRVVLSSDVDYWREKWDLFWVEDPVKNAYIGYVNLNDDLLNSVFLNFNCFIHIHWASVVIWN